jgi:hypothetical protein
MWSPRRAQTCMNQPTSAPSRSMPESVVGYIELGHGEDLTKAYRFGHAYVVSVVSAADGSADAAPDDPVLLIEQRARDLLKAEDVSAAREVTEEALRTSPGRPGLLWLLADVEFADDNQKAGMCCLVKAVKASGGDAEAIGRQIQALSENQLWREALIAIEHLPARVRNDLSVRTATGDFYKAVACHAHAVSGYGDSTGLSSSAKAQRRRSWLRSGGPFIFMRRHIDSWEESQLLAKLRKGRDTSAQLNKVPDLDSVEAHRLKVLMENAMYEWRYRVELLEAISRWQLRLLLAACLPVWLVFYLIVSSVIFLSGTPGEVLGTLISAAVSVGLAILLVRSQVRSDLTLRTSVRPTPTLAAFLLVFAVLAEIAVGEGYEHNALPTSSWWGWVIFGLAALPTVCASMLVAAAIEAVLGSEWILNVPRKNCQVMLLDMFLYLLRDMQSRQLDLKLRLDWSRNLEWGARRISSDLLPSDRLRYLGSGDWLRQRAVGWAEALRYMQRELIASVPGGQPKLEARVRHEIKCLAIGDLGALAWRRPPSSPSQRATRARKAIGILRTLLAGGIPLGAVLVAHVVLHYNTGVFQWLIIVTGVWALLCIVTVIDPAIRDKIDTAQSLTSAIREARRI